MVKLLLAHASEVDARDTDGSDTPLRYACLAKFSEGVVAMLLRAGANDVALTDCGKTPESLVDSGHEGVRLLLRRVAERRRWAWTIVARRRAGSSRRTVGEASTVQ